MLMNGKTLSLAHFIRA